MRIIDDHRERLSLVDTLEAPWHAWAGRDPAGNHIRRKLKRHRRAAGREDVIHVDLPDQRRTNFELYLFVHSLKAKPTRSGMNMARAPWNPVPGHTQNILSFTGACDLMLI